MLAEEPWLATPRHTFTHLVPFSEALYYRPWHRAAEFAGTWFSTFTGYIHRLRGYHGLGEHTYYHSTGKVDLAKSPRSIGSGYAREFRIGWTDDEGGLIR